MTESDIVNAVRKECWQCEVDLTNEPIPHHFVNWVRHCKKCYEMKRDWSFEIREEEKRNFK